MDVVRSEWAGFFDRLSNDHLGDQVEIEVLDPDLGDQLEVARCPSGRRPTTRVRTPWS